jgi:hypothetical protein
VISQTVVRQRCTGLAAIVPSPFSLRSFFFFTSFDADLAVIVVVACRADFV